MDISLIFGSGSLSQGFNSVVINIDKKKQCEGSLPKNERLVELQRRWFALYQALLQRCHPERRSVFEVDEGDITNVSEGSFEEICQEIETVFNQWLNSESFRRIVNTLHQQLGTSESIRVIIESEDRILQKLPWHLWKYVQENSQVGISFTSLNYDLQSSQEEQSEQIKVLAIFGDATGIDLEKDRATLENFTNADITFLEEPTRQEFNDQLWEQNWDILFFAGHSNSNQSGGEIGLNATESLSLADLKNGLRTAINKGLKLAIFNSCDGLELAYLLRELNLPQLIVMQADVPNQVAQHFLDYFLNALIIKEKSVELAHREAKERLEGLENRYLGATWLPVLFQNPSIQWHPSSHSPMKIDWSAIALEMLTRQVTSNPLTHRDGKRFDLDDIFVPLGLVERRKVEKKTDSTSAEEGSEFYQQEEVTRRYERDEFLDDVLTKGNTPKSQGKRLAIIGEPGAGKTTQLQKMGDWLTSQGNQLVIWVSLADLQGQTLEEYLLKEWLKKALKTPRVNQEQEEKFINLFQQQSVWLLLDGVDEMGESTPLRQLAGQLRQGWLSSARVILTCRLNVWDAGKNALDDFDVYRNLDFSDELRQEFTQKWFQESPELAQALEKELNLPGKERIRNLVRNPLRLTLLCAFWERRQGELPETKAQLYKLFVDIFYEWKEEAFPITTAEKQELNQALGRLAKKAIDQPSGRFRLSKELVCSVLGDEETSLFRLAIDIGWLNQVGVAEENPDEPVFAFFHPTFEEYFAACAIEDWHFFLTHYPSNPQQGVYRIFEPQWKEVFLLWLGRKDVEKQEKESLIEALCNFEDNCDNHYFYRIRSRCLAIASIGEFKESQWSEQILDWGIQAAYGHLDQKSNKWLQNYIYAELVKDALLESDSKRVVEKSLDVFNENSYYIMEYYTEFCEIIGKFSPNNLQVINILNNFLISNNDSSHYHFYYPEYFGYIEEIEISGKLADAILMIDPNHIKAQKMAELRDDFKQSEPSYEDLGPAQKIPHSGGLSIGFDSIFSDTETFCEEYGFKDIEEFKQMEKEEISFSTLANLVYSQNWNQKKKAISLLGYKFKDDLRTIELFLDILDNPQEEQNFKHFIKNFLTGLVNNFEDNIQIYLMFLDRLGEQYSIENQLQKIDILHSFLEMKRNGYSDIDYRDYNRNDIYDYLLTIIETTDNQKSCQEAISLLASRVESDSFIKSERLNRYRNKIINCLLKRINNDSLISLEVIYTLRVQLNYHDTIIVTSLRNIITREKDNKLLLRAIESLYEIVPDEPILSLKLKQILATLNQEDIASNAYFFWHIIHFWKKNIKDQESIPIIIPCLKQKYIDENDFYQSKRLLRLLQDCAQNISYPEFYQAWHFQRKTPHPEVEATEPAEFNPSLEQQYLPETLSQLESTPNAYPIPIDADCLADETDKSAIAQELLNQIYEITFPDVNPPTANNAPQIRQNLPEIKHRLQVNQLALILYNCDPESTPELQNLCRQLSRQLKIAWITEQSLEPPLQGFQIQPNLFNVVQNWLNEI